jgi:hypothetical protein
MFWLICWLSSLVYLLDINWDISRLCLSSPACRACRVLQAAKIPTSIIQVFSTCPHTSTYKECSLCTLSTLPRPSSLNRITHLPLLNSSEKEHFGKLLVTLQYWSLGCRSQNGGPSLQFSIYQSASLILWVMTPSTPSTSCSFFINGITGSQIDFLL